MTNLPSTLQRVLAEFDERVLVLMCSTCAADVVFSAKNIPELKTFIESALTESLKDFSAAIEVEKKICLMCGVITSAREHMDFPDHAAYEVGFNAALQAIEAKVKAYMGQ